MKKAGNLRQTTAQREISPRLEVALEEPRVVEQGRLYLCGTPIGNLEDISIRALRVLAQADLIAAEDTRRTRKLLSHYGIHTPLTSCHQHTGREKIRAIVEQIKQGAVVAAVSEAGMPGLSDPGEALVEEALEAGISVTAVPGPTAAISALVTSGLDTARFHFVGFLPQKEGKRRNLLKNLAQEAATLVFYHPARRLPKVLKEMSEIFGNRKAVVARELTKMHEEIFRGTLKDCLEHFEGKEVRGEVTLVVEGNKL